MTARRKEKDTETHIRETVWTQREKTAVWSQGKRPQEKTNSPTTTGK